MEETFLSKGEVQLFGLIEMTSTERCHSSNGLQITKKQSVKWVKQIWPNLLGYLSKWVV